MDKRPRVLAVASEGGHWVQLLRLRPAFDGMELHYVSTKPDYALDVSGNFHRVIDANRWSKWRVARMFLQVLWVILKVRPTHVVTTGAAPGFAALMWGRLLGARCIWIDSIANSEELSGSGVQAKRFAHVWLTQWEHLSKPEGPHYWGGVL